jgi:hypothetical protein
MSSAWLFTRPLSATRRALTRRSRRPVLEMLEDRCVPATFNVNSTADFLTPVPGGVTLRSAIQAANATAGNNTINLTIAGTYKITLPGTAGETDNAAGEFAIIPNAASPPSSTLLLQNTSGGTVIVDGDHLSRVFDINPGNTDNPATKLLVTMQGFTIQNGLAQPGDAAGGSGGGVRDQGNANLTLTNMIVTNNSATADGGGVSMENAPASTPWTLTVNNTTISDNHAGDAGGGIETDGKGKVFINAGSVLSGNTTVNQGAAVWLDAIVDGVASVTITNPGVGYVTPPTVTFSAPQNAGGTTATGTATITGGVVTSVTITNPGSGYTAAPTVTFSPPLAGTTATGTANLGFNNSAALTMTGVLVTGNTAINGPTGAIGNAGASAVILTNCTVMNNFSGTTGGGFGDENNLGTLTVSNSVFLNNTALGDGGAIQEGGPSTTITSSVIQGNSTNASGGGVFANGTTLTILDSTISNNTSGFTSAFPPHFGGGGVEVQTTGTGANASTITNTTIVGNSVLNNAGGNNGGGVDASVNFTGTLTLADDTITGNYADSGGGVFWAGTVGSAIHVQNTVIATNKANVAGPDANNPAGTFTDNGGNLIGISGAGSGNTGFNAATTQRGTVATPLDPLLGPLQNNGGPTLTENPLAGSPVINKGVNANIPAGTTTDQRGFLRIIGGTVDIGAVEFQPPATTTSLTTSANPVTFGQPVTLTAKVVAQQAGSNPVTGTVTFTIDGVTPPQGTVALVNGVATFTFTPAPLTFKSGPHTVTATYNGDVLFTPSAQTLTLTAPALPKLTATVTFSKKKGRFIVQVFDNGVLIQTFMLPRNVKKRPTVFFRDVNGDGVPDLAVQFFRGKMKIQHAFDGVTGKQLF